MCKKVNFLFGLVLLLSMTFSALATLAELPAPAIMGCSTPYPSLAASNLFDKDLNTAYQSNNLGVGTYIDFDFGASTAIGGFKHVQLYWDVYRTIRADLIFSNNSDFSSPIATVHLAAPFQDSYEGLGWALELGEQNATRITEFATPITAQYVKYVITQIASSDPQGGYVGATEMAFLVPEPMTMSLLGLGGLLMMNRKRG